MADTENKYLNNRLKFHTASRVAISTKFSLMQSMNPDGHIVTKQQVWTADNNQFPKNNNLMQWDEDLGEYVGTNYKTTSDGVAATNDLVNVFTNNFTEGNGVEKTAVAQWVYGKNPANNRYEWYLKDSGGYAWTNTNYPAVKLYYQVELSAVAQSDNMSWEVRQQTETEHENSRVMDWVAPTSVKDNGLPIPGYTGIIEGYDGSAWSVIQLCANKSYGYELAKGNWEFVYMSGMVTFHPDYIPSEMGYSKLRITAFVYSGTYLDDTLSAMNQNTANNMMSIKPFTFGVGNMTTDGDIKSIVIPGVVFNVFENTSGIVYGDITYLSGNDAGKTRIDFDWSEVSNAAGSLDENSTFTAMAFVLGNGSPITMLGASAYPFNS